MSSASPPTSTPRATYTHIKKLFFARPVAPWKPGSVIVVTGASSGIGKEISLIYAARKCKLVLAARQKEGLDEVAAMCRRLGSEALVVPTDVTKESDCKNLMQAAVSTFGCIDILVLNAGVGMHNFFHQTEDLSLYRKLMDINYFGYLYCTKYAYTALKQSKGKIVVVSSVSGEMGLPYRTAYCASKFAITGFFEALRAEMDLVKSIGQDESPIKITIVCPPTVSTNLRKNSLTTDPAFTDIADKGALSPAQVAAVIVDAADKELRKVFFPFSAFFGVYVRPFFPDFVDFFAQRKAKL